MELETIDKLKRARIQIQRSNPFFAYLSLYLKFKEAKKNDLPDYAGMGVNADGWLVYKKEFVDKLNERELMGVLVHEILHLSLLHLTRRGSRDPVVWNLAADVCVNVLVTMNGYELPSGGVVTDYDKSITIGGIKVKDCDKKTVEMVYDELEPLLKKMKNKDGYGGIDGKNPFDQHNEGKGDGDGDGKDKKLTDAEKRELEEYWKGKANEALVTAKLRGTVPAGIERLIGELAVSRIGWRALLQKYVQRAIPYDYTFAKPSKKSVSTGYYLPNTIKDYIDVVVAVDTSGSIGQDELQVFLGEIIGIAKAFSSRVKMRLLTHDVEVWDDMSIQNGNIEKIKQLKIKGGGGTSHKVVLEHIKNRYTNTKLTIFFTDGDSDLDDIDGTEYRFDKVFVISERGHDNQLKGFKAQIIKMAEYKYGK